MGPIHIGSFLCGLRRGEPKDDLNVTHMRHMRDFRACPSGRLKQGKLVEQLLLMSSRFASCHGRGHGSRLWRRGRCYHTRSCPCSEWLAGCNRQGRSSSCERRSVGSWLDGWLSPSFPKLGAWFAPVYYFRSRVQPEDEAAMRSGCWMQCSEDGVEA